MIRDMEIHNSVKKTSQGRLFSFFCCCFWPTFFFSLLWILVSLMTECSFEHYKLHLWKKWGRLVGKELWNWRVAKLDAPSIQMAKLNLLLALERSCLQSTCLLFPQMQLVILKDAFSDQRHQNSHGWKENITVTFAFIFLLLFLADVFLFALVNFVVSDGWMHFWTI